MIYQSANSNLLVSIIIPCRNEEKYIERVLSAIAAQKTNFAYEVIIVDALSSDQTLDKIECFRGKAPFEIRVFTNPKIIIPAGLNLGIQHARGSIIIRMDGHAVPHENYLQYAVDTLKKGYEVVGGICLTKPGNNTTIAQAISAAMSSIFGVGDSYFRILKKGKMGRLVDTVPFGCFRKELWERIGGFNENLRINEDYEFNYRVRRAGGKVFLNPNLVTDYYGRKTLKEFAAQFYRYGTWKFIMLMLNPRSIRLRHLVPPLFFLSICVSGIAGIFSKLPIKILSFELALYMILAIFFSLKAAIETRKGLLILVLPFIFFIMHVSWGAGVVISFFKYLVLKKQIF